MNRRDEIGWANARQQNDNDRVITGAQGEKEESIAAVYQMDGF